MRNNLTIPDIGNPDSPEDRTKRIYEFLTTYRSIKGNFVEIGAGEGDTTVKLIAAAKWGTFNRQVLVIDWWPYAQQIKQHGYGGYSYDKFIQRTKDYDNLTVCRHPSQSEEAKLAMRKIRPIAFAFVDGIQTYHECLADIQMCAAYEAQVICVDDVNRFTPGVSETKAAVKHFIHTNNHYEMIPSHKNLMECYLIKV